MGEVFSRWRRAEAETAAAAAEKAAAAAAEKAAAANAAGGGVVVGFGGGGGGGDRGGRLDQTFRADHGVAKVHMFVEVRMADHKHVPEIAIVPAQKGLGVSCNYVAGPTIYSSHTTSYLLDARTVSNDVDNTCARVCFFIPMVHEHKTGELFRRA